MCSCLSSNPKSNQVVRFSPNNERLAVGSRDNFIDVYDARTYASARTLVRCGHTG
jgi:WD40 repeat protein